MSVPLDKLYHLLDDLIDVDKIIYHWYPHGQRNLKYLTQFADRKRHHGVVDVIMHDQEPYDAGFWSDEEIRDRGQEIWQARHVDINSEFLNFLKPRRLNALMPPGAFAKSIIVHSNYNVNNVDTINHEYCYYWCHALIARDWFRYAAVDPLIDAKANKLSFDKTFLCYNRSWSGSREYRIKFAEMLIEHGLLDHFKTWFNPVDNDQHYTDHKFSNKEFATTIRDLEKYLPTTLVDSTASAGYDINDYQSTQWEVVLETWFDSPDIFLTEKILRPMALAQPFVCVSAPGSLSLLRRYGFQTFGDYIDETYDTIADPVIRLRSVINAVQSCLTLDQEEYLQVVRIAQSNRLRFFSQEFVQQVLDEYQINMRCALSKVFDNPQTRWQLPAAMQKTWSENPMIVLPDTIHWV